MITNAGRLVKLIKRLPWKWPDSSTSVFSYTQSTRQYKVSSLILAIFMSVALCLPGTMCSAQSNANALQPVTVDDEVTTVSGSRQLVNGSGTTITTSTPGQISINVTATNFPLVDQCRLYGATGSPYTDTSSSGSPTLYFGPCPDRGNSIFLYSSGAWGLVPCSEQSLSVSSLTTNTVYDIYVYNNSGSVAIDTPVAWLNETTPPTRSTQDGVFVKSGTPTRLYVGSIEVISGTVYSYPGNRGIWNAYNRFQSAVSAVDTTASWSYATATWRIVHGDAATSYGVGVVRIVTGAQIDAVAMSRYTKGPAAAYTSASVIGIGVDSTTPVVAGELSCTSYTNGGVVSGCIPYSTNQLGAHSYEALEYASGSCNFYGSTYGGMFGTTWW